MAFCNKCGKEISDGAAFCSGCGQDLTSTNSTQSNSTASSVQNVVKPAIRKPLLYTFVAIIGLVFVLYFVIVANGASNGSKGNSKVKDKTSNPSIFPCFTLEEYDINTEQFTSKVTGVVSTDSNVGQYGGYIKVKFYDENGNILQDRTGSIGDMAAGESWSFTVYGPGIDDGLASYEITEIGIYYMGY